MYFYNEICLVNLKFNKIITYFPFRIIFMDRPKRACRKPIKYSDEQTPVKSKIDKENIEPNEEGRKSESSSSSKVTQKKRTDLKSKSSQKTPKAAEKMSIFKTKQEEEPDDEIIDVTSIADVSKINGHFETNTHATDCRPISRNESGRYEAQYSPTSRASCRMCSQKVMKSILRIGKEVTIDTGCYSGKGMGWWHMPCFFRKHSHKMKWNDFNGVEDLSVDDQKKLYLHACHCKMPDDLLAEVTLTQEAVSIQNQQLEKQLERDYQTASAEKQEQNAAHLEAVKNTSIEKVIRDNIAKVIEKKTVEELKSIINGNGLNVDRSSAGKGKKKGAPKKADYIHAIINANPLCKIGSLVQRAIRKHIKVDDLKVMLQNVGLPRTGSKLELTKRILEYLGGDYGEESVEEKKTKKNNAYGFDPDEYRFTKYDVYEKNEIDPDIVLKAREGDLEGIKNILLKTGRPVATINASRKWTETEEKWGYDKSWEWHGETPLLAACRNRHVEVVHYLLTNEADPTLEGCISCDVTESPISAVNKEVNSLNNEINEIKTDKIRSHRLFNYNATLLARNLAKYQHIKQLLDASVKFWSKANYAGPQYSDARKNSFSKNPNKPANSTELQKVLGTISVDISVNPVLEKELDLCLKQARKKEGDKRAAEFERKQEETERKRLEMEKQQEEMARQYRQKREEKERVAREFQEKVRAAAATSKTQTNTLSPMAVAFKQRTPSSHLNMLPRPETSNEMEPAGNDILYEGIIVKWLGGYGFLKVDSANFSSNIFVHITDIISQDCRICGVGTRLKFKIEPSVRKPGTVQAKNAIILSSNL